MIQVFQTLKAIKPETFQNSKGYMAIIIDRQTSYTMGSIDSQSVKTTALAGIKGFDAGKLIQRRKRPILVDTGG